MIWILHPSLFHLSHSSISYSLLLWRTDCYSFQSIRISVLPTLFIVIISMTVRYHHTVWLSTHQSIHMDTKQYDNDVLTQRSVIDLPTLLHSRITTYSHWSAWIIIHEESKHYEVINGIRDTDSFIPFQFMITTNQAMSMVYDTPSQQLQLITTISCLDNWINRCW